MIIWIEAYGNEWISLEEIEQKRATPPHGYFFERPQGIEAVLERLRNEGLISQEEYERFEREHTIRVCLGCPVGRPYQCSSELLCLGIRRFRHLPSILIRFFGMGDEENHPCPRPCALRLVGLSPDRIERVTSRVSSSSAGRQQRRFRGRMLRNHYNGMFPMRLIRNLENSLEKICQEDQHSGI